MRENLWVAFLAQTDGLAHKRGPILVQLPPSFSFDATVVTPFLDLLRTVYGGSVVCKPRHATWFWPSVASLLNRYGISRVAADPPPVPAAGVPADWPRLAYFDCTAHQGSTGRGMTNPTSRRLLRLFGAFRAPTKCGAYSTIPQVVPLLRMRGSYTNVCSSLHHLVASASE
jgi:Protein of unknown function DUF72